MKLTDIKVLAEALGIVGGLLNGSVVAVMAVLLPTVTTSPTSQAYIRLFVIIGGSLGFFFTLTAAAGEGKQHCLRLRTRFLWASCAAASVALFMILLTEGRLAYYVPALTNVRDFFLDSPLLANLTVGAGAGLVVYFVVGAVVASWPKVWSVKLG